MNSRDAEAVAAKAWNATKSPADPPYDLCAVDHRLKLAYLASEVVPEPGSSIGVQGLEDFEAEVRRIVFESKPQPKPKALGPAKPSKEK